jgi:lipopolysaccharide transport system ATP-binding protein
MKAAVSVQNVSKCYRLGETHAHTMSEQIARVASRLIGRKKETSVEPNDFWALRDVSMEIAKGEMVGIIGGNGAGKSTLLKILSRITQPTSGRALVRGQMSSLLEVGTGFHPELTGRENVFLNGTILGMRKAEVARRFDEIVAFSGVEKFIDTPVKRYSSGMYVRLAFAVAAHMEPDVLVIDEVLAVGDAEFQKRCLGKMNDVAREGRTVLFVSHNMQALSMICSRAVLMSAGRVVEDGTPDEVIATYLSKAAVCENLDWQSDTGLGSEFARLTRIGVSSQSERPTSSISSSSPIYVEMDVKVAEHHSALCIGFDLMSDNSGVVLRSYDTDVDPEIRPKVVLGQNRLRCEIPAGLLSQGRYQIAPRIGLHNQEWIVHPEPLIQFQTHFGHGRSPFWATLDGKNRPGAIAPILKWQSTGEEVVGPGVAA